MNDVLQPVQSRTTDTSAPGIVQIQKCEGLGVEILKYLQMVARDRRDHVYLESAGFQAGDSAILATMAEELMSLTVREVLRIGLSPRLWIDGIQIDEPRLVDALDQSALDQSHQPKRIMPARHAALVLCYINRLAMYNSERTMSYKTFGLGFDACHRLLNASQQQLNVIVNAPCILSIRINWNRLEKLLIQVEEQRALESLQDKLLENRAPHDLMKNLYGWSTNDFAERRRRIGLTDTGRPRAIPDEHLQPVINCWLSVPAMPIAKRYLHVSVVSGYCIASLVGANLEKVADIFSKRKKP